METDDNYKHISKIIKNIYTIGKLQYKTHRSL